MKENVGNLDKNIRFLIGAILVLIGLFVPMHLEWRVVLFVAAAVALLTGFFGL